MSARGEDDAEADEALDRLAEEFTARVRRGEPVTVEGYARAHPALAEAIREIFPVLADVEEAKGDRGAARGEALPARIGPYAVVRELGRGGMGRVLEAIGPRGERVAVKVIHRHLVATPGTVERFLREAEAGRRVEHPSVVRTLSSGTVREGGEVVPYLVLEYVEGQSLRSLLLEVGHVPERLARHVGARVAEGLAAIHAAGVVHRDVKPENVVLTADETVKLADFGVALVTDAPSDATKKGAAAGARPAEGAAFVGSFAYAAPEQLAGLEVGPRADLYSLGVVLHELATGVHPAAAASGREGAGAARRPSAFLFALTAELLSASPADRPASASALAEALDRGERSAWWAARAGASPREAVPAFERATEFVGREAEWAALDRAFEAVVDGSGRVVVVTGDAGMGKSRFLAEWAAAVERGPGAPAVAFAAHAPGAGGAGADPLHAAVASLAARATTTDVRPAASRIADLLGGDPAVAAATAAHLSGAPAPEGAPPPSREAVSSALVRLLRRVAASRPVVLVVEDLHFAPAAVAHEFVGLARALAGSRVLLVASSRPPPPEALEKELAGRARVERVALEGLAPEAAQDLLARALRTLGVGAKSVARVVGVAGLAEGRPLLLLELAREAAARTARGETVSGVPSSVRGHVEAQLATLSPGDRELVLAAACAGFEFDPLDVARALDRPPLAVLRALGRLERSTGIVVPAGPLYRFRHHVVQEAMHEGLDAAAKTALHGALARALAASPAAGASPREADARAVALCEHALLSGRLPAARAHVARAVRALRERAEYRRAVALADAASATPGLLSTPDRVLVLMALGSARMQLGLQAEATAALEEARALAREGPADARLDALELLATVYAEASRTEDALAVDLEASRIAAETGDVVRAAKARARCGQSLYVLRRLDEATRECEAAAATLRALGNAGGESEASVYAARCLLAVGRTDDARAHLERSVALTRAVGDRQSESIALHTLSWIALRAGRFAESLDVHREALALNREVGGRYSETTVLAGLATALLALGRLDEASEAAAEAAEIADATGLPFARVEAYGALGSAAIAQGLLEKALDALTRAHGIAQSIGNLYRRCAAASRLGELYARLGRLDEAEALLASAETDTPHEQSFLLGARGRLAEHRGDFPAAVERFAALVALRDRGGSTHGQWDLALGRSLLRAGRSAEAAAPLAQALAWGRDASCPRVETLARAWSTHLEGGDVLSARLALERTELSLPRPERLEAHVALWEASRVPAHLAAARRELAFLLRRSPRSDRRAMLTRVELHRRAADAPKR